MLKTRELFAGLYALEDERVRQFLVIGEERALRDGKLTSDAHPALPCRVYHGEATDFLF